MLGAIIGDIVGSRFEWNNIKSKDFDFLTYRCKPTDDSIMSLAIAKAILECDGQYRRLEAYAIKWMQTLGRKYPDAGYGWYENDYRNSEKEQCAGYFLDGKKRRYG